MEVATAGRPTDFYHGTSLEAILAIQQSGFRVDLCGTNAGAALGHGVYVTTTLEKALNYAKGPSNNPNPARGGVLVLEVDLGRCYTVRSSSVSERTDWQQRGYHSAWAAEGVIGDREENCVRDPGRIRITNVVLPHTGEARRLGYEIRSGRLERAGAVQMRSGPAHMFTRAQLKAAVEKGDVAAVWSWIDGGGQIDLPFEIGPYSGISMLEMSAAHGHERMVDLLLRRGANVNLLDDQGSTALMWAVNSNEPAIVRQLLQAGADKGIRSKQGMTALQYALEGRNSGKPHLSSDYSECVNLLL